MGGHGGLNILPQKSWNVYGRENRLKVARDEAKHEEEQKKLLEKQRLAESEARRVFLLRQAALKHGHADPGEAAEQAQLSEEPQQPGLLQHINFFAEHEAQAAHPEVAQEARKEARRRGNAETQTSDARFDERFQLGHGLTGAAAQPWYTQSRSALLDDDAAGAIPAVGRLEDDGRLLMLHSGTGQSGLLHTADIEGSSRKAGKKDRKKPKEKRSKEKHSKKSRHRDKGEKGEKRGINIEKLRQERLQRERQERERARQAIMSNSAQGKPAGKAYNAAYGNVAPSRRPHVAA